MRQIHKNILLALITTIYLASCARASNPPSTSFPKTATIEPDITQTPYPSNADFVQIAWFYKPPAEEFYSILSSKFDKFILTNHDEEERDKMRALGLKAPVYQYLLLASIQDPGSCEKEPYGNQVANRPGDFCRISTEHPDWFLLDAFGQRITSDGNYYAMDPGNEEYRAFWLERAKEIQDQYQWDGIFIDNAEGSLSKFKRKMVILANYPDDESFQSAVEGFLAYLDQNYFSPEGRPVIANIVEMEDNEVWFRYLQHLDGAMLENFAVDWNNYYSQKEWVEQISMLAKTQSMKKSILLIAQGSKDDLQKELFSFATYLLLSDGDTSFRYTNYESYREVWWYDNYEINLGRPTGSMYVEDGIWIRDFEKGSVQVDPLTHKGDIFVNP